MVQAYSIGKAVGRLVSPFGETAAFRTTEQFPVGARAAARSWTGKARWNGGRSAMAGRPEAAETANGLVQRGHLHPHGLRDRRDHKLGDAVAV